MVLAVLVVVAGVSGFVGGMKYQQNQRSTNAARQFQGTRQAGIRPVSGSIIAVDDKSVTVKMADGSSRIVWLADTASRSALVNGEKVMVVGTDNADGSVTATNISLR